MSRSPPSKEDYPLNSPDTFVSESSISIAAVCADGIIMIALHDAQQEPLLYPEEIYSHKATVFLGLPESSRVSLRIETIDAYGMAIITAGWRTDCNMLASKARAFSTNHMERFFSLGIRNNNDQGLSQTVPLKAYGSHIANLCARWLATCSFSPKFREMHCVGLLGMSSDSDKSNVHESHLWLIDSTGVYAVRAHAIGLGAAKINLRLMKIDLKSLKHEDAISSIFTLLREESHIVEKSNQFYIEIAVIQSSTLKRKRLTSIN